MDLQKSADIYEELSVLIKIGDQYTVTLILSLFMAWLLV